MIVKDGIIGRSLYIAILSLLFTGMLACKSQEPVREEASEEQEEDRLETAEHTDLEALYWERVESSRQRFTEADVDFMIGMIAHHAQALIMSDLAPKNSANDQIQRLARRIHSAQLGEIAVMQQWLRDRGQPVPEVEIDGIELIITGLDGPRHHHEDDPEDRHRDHEDRERLEEMDRTDSAQIHHHMDHSDMPGMLSNEQLRELRDTGGSEFDRLFLEYMIEHHIGAVVMVNDLLATDGAAQDTEAFRLVSDIHTDQLVEIRLMREMLERMKETQ